MEMDGVSVGAVVFHDEAIALAGGEDGLVGVGVGLAVDEPLLFGAVAMEFGFKDEVDAMSAGGRGVGIGRSAELAVVPDELFGLDPGGFAGGAGVLDDDAHAGGLDVFADFAEDPDAGVVELDESGDAFGGREGKHGDGLW